MPRERRQMVDDTRLSVQEAGQSADHMKVRSLRRAILLPCHRRRADACLSGTPAQGAASGVVINSPTGLAGSGDSLVSGLGVGWVRSFAPWNSFEPSRGALSQSEAGALEQGHRRACRPAPRCCSTWSTRRSGSRAQATRRPPQTTRPTTPASPARWPNASPARSPPGRSGTRRTTPPGGREALTRAPTRRCSRTPTPRSRPPTPAQRSSSAGSPATTTNFLQQLYEHGAKGSFDAAAVHTDTACNTISPYEALHNGPTTRASTAGPSWATARCTK